MRSWLRRVPASEVLGINRRNLEYVFALNPHHLFEQVDDKVLAKEILSGAGLPTPETFEVVNRRADIAACIERLSSMRDFVVKPSRGFGGRGVKVVRSGEPDLGDLRFHMAAILSGMFSLDRARDRVLVERRVRESSVINALHGGSGVSDIRVVVYDGRPLMGMLRLPCRKSGDTANLHSGGIGVGIDLDRGVTTHAIHRGRPIELHPDTGRTLGDQPIPDWATILELSRDLNSLFGMGYLGADIVLDETLGAQILEVNARPGLAIQLANRQGLVAAMGEIEHEA